MKAVHAAYSSKMGKTSIGVHLGDDPSSHWYSIEDAEALLKSLGTAIRKARAAEKPPRVAPQPKVERKKLITIFRCMAGRDAGWADESGCQGWSFIAPDGTLTCNVCGSHSGFLCEGHECCLPMEVAGCVYCSGVQAGV